MLSAWALSSWLLQQVRVLAARSTLIWCKSADGSFGLHAIQHIYCIRVRARAAIMLMRGAFGTRIRMHLLTRWSLGVCLERRACALWQWRFVRNERRHMQALVACLAPRQTRAACTFRLIPTELGLIPHKKTTNPTNPTNPDLQILPFMNVYLKIRISRISGISRVFEWD